MFQTELNEKKHTAAPVIPPAGTAISFCSRELCGCVSARAMLVVLAYRTWNSTSKGTLK